MKIKKRIHIVSYFERDSANNDNWYVSTTTTIEAFKKNGYITFLYKTNGNRNVFIQEVINIYSNLKENDTVYLIVDGKASLDKFSLLKILKPSISLVWEIHAVINEYLWFHKGFKAQAHIFFKNLLRSFFALFVDSSFSLSKPLQKYSNTNLKIQKSFLISSVVKMETLPASKRLSKKTNFILSSFDSKNTKFIVYWAGNASLPWQGLNIIEKVAIEVYKLDKGIIFIVTGDNSWHNFSFQENIVFYKHTTFENNMLMAKKSDVCLALYNDGSKKVTGFDFYYSPRKVIEFMGVGKCVIATNTLPIKNIITNNVDGFLTKNNSKEIAKIILNLKNNPQLQNRVAKMAINTIQKKFTYLNLATIYSKSLT